MQPFLLRSHLSNTLHRNHVFSASEFERLFCPVPLVRPTLHLCLSQGHFHFYAFFSGYICLSLINSAPLWWVMGIRDNCMVSCISSHMPDHSELASSSMNECVCAWMRPFFYFFYFPFQQCSVHNWQSYSSVWVPSILGIFSWKNPKLTWSILNLKAF